MSVLDYGLNSLQHLPWIVKNTGILNHRATGDTEKHSVLFNINTENRENRKGLNSF